MYQVKFIKDNGDVFLLGTDNNIVFDIDGLSGIDVDLGKSQGFSQIGESIDTQSVGGKLLKVKGVIYKNLASTKNAIIKAFSPFSSGRLVFEDKYYIYVYVKESPVVAPTKKGGAFMLALYAPFPFFKEIAESTFYIGTITPMFSFPVNYETPHIFGTKSAARYINVTNKGDLKSSYRIDLTSEATSTNITLTNLETFEFLKINGTLNAGERISVYRDDNNQLKAVLYKGSEETDIISWIDEESTLYEMNVGDNLIVASDDNGGVNLTAQLTFNNVVGGVYET